MTASSIVLMSDRRVAAIPVQERGDVLIDARVHGLVVDDRTQDAAGAWAHVRQGVLTRLQQAWPGRTPADALSLSTAGGQRA